MTRLIVFDLDDTLYPEKAYVRSGLKALSKFLEKKFGIVGFYEGSIRIFEKGVRGRIFESTLANMGIDYGDELIPEMVECYDSHAPNIGLYEDAMSTLRYLKCNNRLALLTDGFPCIQKRKIEALKIESLFDKIIYTDMLGREFRKPNLRSFREAAKAFEVENPECVYVADNSGKDFLAPNKLGWLTIKVKREDTLYTDVLPPCVSYKAKIVIENLHELINIFT
jgi:putative hydrolase of the HAD superfamily